MKYDTLIIGAGLSGLAAGVRLAYYDKRVAILERHTTIGGLNSFYRLRGRNYDVGLHAVTNFSRAGAKTGPLAKLLRQLRLTWDDFALAPQFGSAVAFPQCRLRFSNDADLLVDEVASTFPSDADRFRRLVAELDAADLGRFDPAAPTARQFLAQRLSDPLLIEMLLCPLFFYGSPTPDDLEFTQFAIMFRSVYREGFGRPYSGVRQILKTLVRRYKSLGGQLRLRAGVDRIVVDNGRAVGVILDSGEQLEADHVLSSAGFVETLQLCEMSDHLQVPPADREPGGISFVESVCTLDRQPAELDHRATIVFYNDRPQFEYRNPSEPCDLHSGIICSPNNFEYDKPLAEGVVRVTALANHAYWRGLPEPEYVAEKERWHERVLDSAVRFMPEFREHVVDVDMFTPRTILRFTGHLQGNVYGAPRKHWDGRTPVDRLYVCGTDQGYLGIVGSMVSGISMANAHLLV